MQALFKTPPNKKLSFEIWGLWDIDNIKVKYITDTWVQFSCHHNVINGETEIKNVTKTFLDRLRGVNFDEVVLSEYDKFVNKFKARNDKIIELKQKAEKVVMGGKNGGRV